MQDKASTHIVQRPIRPDKFHWENHVLEKNKVTIEKNKIST